jgi:ribosomal protein S18 acetylase RimI-like enzyme
MTESTVSRVQPGEESRAIGTIVLAFAEDPTVRWCWPDSHQYLEAAPEFVRTMADAAFGQGTATKTAGFAGAALWLPPGAKSDEERMEELMKETIDPRVCNELMTLLEAAAAYHPKEPHWYLPLIGVDPAHRGNGHGGALLKHTLEKCDQEGLPAYLESSNPRNISLYERHGFKALATLQVGSSPPFTPMLRLPQ